jgi:hypothetical protein
MTGGGGEMAAAPGTTSKLCVALFLRFDEVPDVHRPPPVGIHVGSIAYVCDTTHRRTTIDIQLPATEVP